MNKKTVLGALTICAGVPLLALGVGPATAWADTTAPSTDTTATETIDDGGLAISWGGIPLWQSGNSTAETVGPSLAIASNNSHANAYGWGSLAIATNNSYATAGTNQNFLPAVLNTAIADNNSTAGAGTLRGNGNSTIAKNGSTASVPFGSSNTVIATDNSSARAYGDNNTVTAASGSTADVQNGDSNRITVNCGGSVNLFVQSNQVITSGSCAG